MLAVTSIRSALVDLLNGLSGDTSVLVEPVDPQSVDHAYTVSVSTATPVEGTRTQDDCATETDYQAVFLVECKTKRGVAELDTMLANAIDIIADNANGLDGENIIVGFPTITWTPSDALEKPLHIARVSYPILFRVDLRESGTFI